VLRLVVDPGHPDERALARAAETIAHGGLVAIPTDTLYGLAADPFSEAAVARLFEAKGRPTDRAIPLIAADRAQVEAQVGPLLGASAKLADRFWPGPLTVLLPAPPSLAPAAAGTSRVGIRVPAHDVARGLCRASGRPLTATSANWSGRAPTDDPDLVADAMRDRIDILLDAGKAPGGPPSTIVDATGSVPRLIRPGAIDWEVILACLRA
jgi:L-threonylcarbamoyladenylate synthase